MMIGQSNDVYVASNHYILVLINTVNRVIFAPPTVIFARNHLQKFSPRLEFAKTTKQIFV